MKAKTANKGDKFGRWTAIKDSYIKEKETRLLCECECGTVREKTLCDISKGRSISCGCYTKEKNSTHGKSHTRLYIIYKCMMQRCNNKNRKEYSNYGAKGINVCQEWNNNFLIFEKWALENGYKDGLEIDRIDNHKGYCPNNCRWVTHAQNMYNKKPLSHCKYKGIQKIGKKYCAKIRKDYKQYYIGIFNTEEEAALAYNEKAIELFGQYACLNIITP